MSVNLVVEFNERPDNMHDQFVDIMNFYDGHEATINGNGEVESVRFYWYDIPKESVVLKEIMRRLQSDKEVVGQRFRSSSWPYAGESSFALAAGCSGLASGKLVGDARRLGHA